MPKENAHEILCFLPSMSQTNKWKLREDAKEFVKNRLLLCPLRVR